VAIGAALGWRKPKNKNKKEIIKEISENIKNENFAN